MILGRLIVPLMGIVATIFVVRADDVSAPEIKVPLQFDSGHMTAPVDHGRPVVLVAAALGVPESIFREAFRHVHPAGPGEQPRPEDVRRNKHELLSRLAKYGVTNERLDEVSNYYRYPPGSLGLWRHVEAAGFAIVRGHKVVRIEITEHGAGYTTAPIVMVPGVGLTQYLCARLDFNTDLARNGSVAMITPSALGDREGNLVFPATGTTLLDGRTEIHNGDSPPPSPPPPPR